MKIYIAYSSYANYEGELTTEIIGVFKTKEELEERLKKEHTEIDEDYKGLSHYSSHFGEWSSPDGYHHRLLDFTELHI